MTQIIEMIDAAMVEMASITPPLRRSECEQLIRAALSAMEKQEPVAYVMEFNDGTTTIQKTAYWDCKSVTPLYTAPKVIPLTDEEIEQAVEIYGIPWARYREDKYGFQTIPILSRYDYDFARAIEATIRGQQP